MPGAARGWPLVGRAAELAALVDLLGPAGRGHAQFTLVVGEPGIGKSRLVEELAGRAAADGFMVVTGRCCEDEGAPPLWPWTLALGELAERLGQAALHRLAGADVPLLTGLLPGAAVGVGEPPVVAGSPDAERFRVNDAVARLLAAAAEQRPLVVVLDDLHWADASSLRLLWHLADRLVDARVLVVATRRAHPEPEGPLAEAGARLARRHALRIDLGGLTADGVADLARAVTGAAPGRGRAAALRERTDGNPFFLVELLRLAEVDVVPAAVHDVVGRRVAGLPEGTQELLRAAAVAGRSFGLELLAAVARVDADAALDGLEPALAAGLVLEEAVPERFRFAHALVRDVVYRAQPAARRARRHAAVARALAEAGAERLSEVARHWLAAGPAHAAVAWPVAVRAAEQARALHGYEEAAALLAAARAAQEGDRGCGARERYDLLMAHAAACRWIADRDGQLDALDRACLAAAELGDVERMARAAVGSADGTVWTLREIGVVHGPAVAALRRCVRELPPGDADLRCRALLTLGAELYYADAPEERQALVDEGLAMAGRLGDPALSAWAALTASVAIWGPANAERRRALIDEALAAGGLDPAVQVHLLTCRAIAAMEGGRLAEAARDVVEARAGAQRLRLPFPLVAISGMETGLRAMQGRFAEAEEPLAETADLGERTTVLAVQLFAIAPLFVRAWQGGAGELVPLLRAAAASGPPVAEALLLFALVRSGRLDEAAAVLDRPGFRVPDESRWPATFELAAVAHAAWATGRPGVAAQVYRRLAPLAGNMASLGSGGPIGPVDAYLALAAAATGETSLARRHAEDAATLLHSWELPVAADWFAGVRQEAGI